MKCESSKGDVHRVSYWPTAAAAAAPLTLLVGGKRPTGETVIEVWTIAPPEVRKADSLDGSRSEWAFQPLAKVSQAYDAAVVGKDMVTAIFKLRGKDSSAIVQFADSRDLYELIWVEPYRLQLLLSASAEPALATPEFDHFHAGDLGTRGYVYVFSAEGMLGTVDALVLIDENRDGILDHHDPMPNLRYRELGLQDATAYRELHGVVQK